MYSASFDTIKPKDVINPVNEVEVEGYGFNRVFLFIKFLSYVIKGGKVYNGFR